MSADTTAADIGLPDGFKGEQSVPPTRSTTRRVPSTTAGSIGTRSSSSSRLERRTSWRRCRLRPAAEAAPSPRGGHQIAGLSAVEGGVLIDLSSLKGVHVDPGARNRAGQRRVLWGEYDRELEMFGLATPGGRVTTTGVGGFCLGGGYGWLSTKHGLTCDNLVGADLLTANGQLMHVTEDTNPELMWALRGAGANFGVVTSFEFKVHPIRPLMMAGMIVVPNDGSRAEEAMRAYRDYIETAPTDLVTALATVLAPPEDFVPPELVGTPAFAMVVAWLGDPSEEEAVAPLRKIMEGGIDLLQPMPYTTFQAMLDGFAPKGWLNYHRGQHVTSLPDGVIDDYLSVGRDIGLADDPGHHLP